jgi:ADP-ribose pyrophosphatase YjhB (NUDIX family)
MGIIKLKTMLLIQHKGRLLVSKGHDKVKRQNFYRLLGGSVEFTETAETGIRREVMEELQSEINDLKLIGVIENIFRFQGKSGHEIDFLFCGDLANSALFEQDHIPLNERYGEFFADWVPAEDVVERGVPLYPPYNYQILIPS